MPLVRISLRQGGPPGRGRAVGEAVHQAMVETIGVPPLDRFQVITEHPADDLVYDPEDVLVSLVEVPRENWSFGNGVAQYAA
jgi:4-oxalocrotonate tautomerase